MFQFFNLTASVRDIIYVPWCVIASGHLVCTWGCFFVLFSLVLPLLQPEDAHTHTQQKRLGHATLVVSCWFASAAQWQAFFKTSSPRSSWQPHLPSTDVMWFCLCYELVAGFVPQGHIIVPRSLKYGSPGI